MLLALQLLLSVTAALDAKPARMVATSAMSNTKLVNAAAVTNIKLVKHQRIIFT